MKEFEYLKPLIQSPDRDIYVNVSGGEYTHRQLNAVGEPCNFPNCPTILSLKEVIDKYIKEHQLRANAFTWEVGSQETVVQLYRTRYEPSEIGF